MGFSFKKRSYLPPTQDQNFKGIILIAGIVSLAAYLSVKIFAQEQLCPASEKMIKSAQIMEQAISAICNYCDTTGFLIDETVDPNRTGLIGSEISGIATTLGNLEAKRTTTNPNFAALIVHLLKQAGVIAGDTIAIGCSASFPALMIASLAAAKALEVYPVMIISLGASSHGATNPDFNMLHIYEVLLREKIFDIQPAAISLGGDRDVGIDFKPSIKEKLIQQINGSGIPFIFEPDLQKNVARRMAIYQGNSFNHKISAFINTGGSYANFGTSELALKLKSGLNEQIMLPPKEERGVLFEMADRKIPIIHLLYIKGLAIKYRLPWDPIPLPKAGETELFQMRSNSDIRFKLIAGIYSVILIVLSFYGVKSNSSPH